MKCTRCGHSTWDGYGGDPDDHGCLRCGHDPDDEGDQADADEAADNRRRSKETS